MFRDNISKFEINIHWIILCYGIINFRKYSNYICYVPLCSCSNGRNSYKNCNFIV